MQVVSLLHNGRRRVRQDGTYNGPARGGPVRHISEASLSVQRVHEQNRTNLQSNRATSIPDPAPGMAAKGKPRLLLMGQRRYVYELFFLAVFCKRTNNVCIEAANRLSRVWCFIRCLQTKHCFSNLQLESRKILCSKSFLSRLTSTIYNPQC